MNNYNWLQVFFESLNIEIEQQVLENLTRACQGLSLERIRRVLSKIIANYFLSTIVADHIASAIFLSSTNASPLYFQTRP